MKKIIAIIALLLVLSFSFAACDQYSPDSPSQIVPNDQFDQNNYNDPIIGVNDPYAVDYSSIANEWLQYVEFVDKTEDVKELHASKVLTDENVDVRRYGHLLVSTKEESIESVDDSNATLVVATRKETKIYDLKTGSVRSTYVSIIPATNAGGLVDPDAYTANSYVNYNLIFNASLGIYEVDKTTLVLPDDYVNTEDSEPVYSDYVRHTTSSIYNLDGKAIVENQENANVNIRTPLNNADNRYLADIADNTYLMTADGEVIKVFPRGEEYDVPAYKVNAITSREGYAYFEAYDFKYVLTEKPAITQKVGDLMMYTIPGMSVKIFDGEYNSLVEYSTDCYHVAGYAVIGGGKLYVCEYVLLPSTATEYDFMLGEMKFNAIHKLVDPNAGKVETLELDFVVSSLFNNLTTEIRSVTTVLTANVHDATDEFKSLMDTCKVNDGYTLGQMQKIQEGSLATETVFVVFDDELNVVAELPKFMPNQLGYASFLTENTMLVNVTAKDNKTVSYIVDTKSGKASLFVHEPLGGDKVYIIEGGYFFDGKLYDKQWNTICDFSKEDYHFETVINGYVYYTVYDDSYQPTLYKAHVGNDYDRGYFSTYNLATGNSISIHDGYISSYVEYEVQVDESSYQNKSYTVYSNLSGSTLLSVGEDIDYTMYKNGTSAYYTGTGYVNITPIGDGQYVAEYTANLTLKNYEYSADFPSTYSYTTYYIFK